MVGIFSMITIRTPSSCAWNTFARFATRVALADGLARTGFIAWLGKASAVLLQRSDPQVSVVVAF